MLVTVVGSGDAFGSGGRFQTCIALAGEGPAAPVHTLVDCGATSLVALRKADVDLAAIETVLVSHLHGDHFGGLPFLILDGQFRRRTKDLTVVGPPGTNVRLAEVMEILFPGSSTVRRRFNVRVIEHADGDVLNLERMTVTAFEVRHASGAPAYALRVRDREAGSSVAYSGDTEWTEALVRVADGADVFLCEGYAPQPVRWHLDLDSLARNADRLACRRLVLTHMSPATLGLNRLDWEAAHDGMVINPSGG
ncbi:MBL fold metallo-hydrolase [Pseudonocardia xinjiangensis]|uniref:MBL fold metallo-hydrolase n=1 Tax=Pseudonocardia xinjiangensis TaxID=75289 RepID=A0ABX1R987_9PSEU|nr:MBL fold metallo-hydrolase [Pseudonocardia xinjiangensis]NMH75788.1 MBL fold metallo-hydrolase [Pseudonocardia xinjiangensis]